MIDALREAIEFADMALLEKAIEIALKAHAGQKDKAGEPYILHPLRVMGMMETEHERVVAVLHDVLEDSDILYNDLYAKGVPINLLDSLDALTKRKAESYSDYIERCAADPIAKAVKLADLFDNLSPDRLCRLPYEMQKRLELKYLPARYRLLNGAWPYEAGVDAALAEGEKG